MTVKRRPYHWRFAPAFIGLCGAVTLSSAHVPQDGLLGGGPAVDCPTLSAASAAGSNILNVGQPIAGRATSASVTLHAGAIPCFAAHAQPPLLGDCDPDGDVDLFDYDKFQNCFTGPTPMPLEPECLCADFNGDDRVDLYDWGRFQAIFTGP